MLIREKRRISMKRDLWKWHGVTSRDLCSTLQCVAVCCRVLRCVAKETCVCKKRPALHHGNVLVAQKKRKSQRDLQTWKVTEKRDMGYTKSTLLHVAAWCGVSQCVAVCCSVLQCVPKRLCIRIQKETHKKDISIQKKIFTAPRSVMRCVAVWCGVLQCVAVCSNKDTCIPKETYSTAPIL